MKTFGKGEAAQTGLGRLGSWAVVLGGFGSLTLVALVALWGSEQRIFGPWWVGLLVGGVLAGLAWRWVGPTLVRWWRVLHLPAWVLPAGLFTLFFVVKVIPALALPTQQRSDFGWVYTAALNIGAGDFSFNQSAYWHFFAYQTPFAAYEALVLHLSGGSIVPLLLVGALAMAGTNLLVFLMARRITGSTAAGLFAGFGYLLYTGPYLEINVLTNDHLSAFFLYLGSYLVLGAAAKTRGKPFIGLAIAGGVVLQLGTLARPAGALVMAALLVTVVLVPVMQRRRVNHATTRQQARLSAWGPWRRAATSGAIALAVYMLLGVGAGAAVKASGLNPEGIANNLPEWKIALGPVEGAVDGPSWSEIGIRDSTPNPEAPRIAREIVRSYLEHLPQTWPQVLKRQTQTLWAQNDTASFAFWPGLEGRPLYELPDPQTATLAHYLVLLERGFFVPAVLLAAIGVLLLHRGHRWNYISTFLCCFFAAYCLVHLAIEVQPRYRYLAMPAIYALTAPTWAVISGQRQQTPDSSNLT